MAEEYTLQRALEEAIAKEIEAQKLYTEIGETVTDDAARDILKQLVKVEKKHEELLRSYLRGELGEGTLETGHVLDYRIAEHFNLPEVKSDMKLDEVLLLAANREKASHELYLFLAAAHPPGNIKKLFEELASQELDHKHRMEFIYSEVAFPQTSGG